MNLRATFLWTMIAAFGVTAAMGIGVLLVDFGYLGERVLITALLVGIFSLLGLGSAVVLDRRQRRWLGVVGIVFAILSLANWVFLAWLERSLPWRAEETIAKIGTALTVVAVWAPHLGLLGLLPLRGRRWRLVRVATYVFASMLGAFIAICVIADDWDEWQGRTLGVLTILTACGTVVTPLLAVVERVRHGGEPASLGRRVVVELVCPRCGAEQRLPCGPRRCTTCGLRIRIDVDEPRCDCGYLTFRLEGDACPECGRPIDAARRWPSAGSADEG